MDDLGGARHDLPTGSSKAARRGLELEVRGSWLTSRIEE